MLTLINLCVLTTLLIIIKANMIQIYNVIGKLTHMIKNENRY